MTDKKSEYKNQLVRTIHIQNDLVNNGDLFDPKTKEALVNQGNYWSDRLSNESFSLTQLKFVSSNILTLWKESVGIATEMFWVELKKNNIDFERKDELNFALQKGRFRRVDVGMAARKDWSVMKEFDAITNRFTKDEIEKISDIIESDEKTRLELLKRCLRKKEIPQTQYLKFGDSMAYMSHCGLLNKHFNEIEVDELYDIWNNFKIR